MESSLPERSSPILIRTFRDDGTVMSFGEGWDFVVGADPAGSSGSFSDRVVGPNASELARNVARAISRKESFAHRFGVRTASGVLWFHEHVVPRRADGEAAAALGRALPVEDWQTALDTGLVSDERHRALFEHNRTVQYVIDPETMVVVDANPAAEAFFGVPRSTLRGMKIRDVELMLREETARLMVRSAEHEHYHFVFQHKRQDGSDCQVEIYSGLIVAGGRQLIYSIVHDITDRVRTETALEESERNYRELFNEVNDAIFVYDIDTFSLVDANRSAVLAFGFSDRESFAEGRRWAPAPFDEAHFHALLMRAKAGEEQRFEWLCCGVGGATFWEEVRVRPARVSGKLRLVAVSRDITQRKRDEELLSAQREKLAHLAQHDSLTELPNRLLFRDRLQEAVSLARRRGSLVAVMFIDLDRFKPINDTLGHEVGDALLREVARRVRRCLREEDTVARFGGDEFTVMLPFLERQEIAAVVARRILDELSGQFVLLGNEVYAGASIGISVFPADGENPDSLLKNADTAMYLAKDRGRNTFQFYTESLNVKAQRRSELELGLRHALARNELSLHYQPQVDAMGGRLVGVEALLRWQSAELGRVNPGEFIPVAEESGLIVPIGEWVLQTACMQTEAWRRSGVADIRMAVNLSVRQFARASLVADVKRILDETGIDPENLELELTESILIHSTESALSTLGRLRELGVRLSIDDFGTGYSSLAYLKQLPIHQLKIALEFTRGIPADESDSAIARSTIYLTKSLGLEVIAEGVETAEQVAFFELYGCDLLQGYYFAKPMPAPELEEYCRRRRDG